MAHLLVIGLLRSLSTIFGLISLILILVGSPSRELRDQGRWHLISDHQLFLALVVSTFTIMGGIQLFALLIHWLRTRQWQVTQNMEHVLHHLAGFLLYIPSVSWSLWAFFGQELKFEHWDKNSKMGAVAGVCFISLRC